MVTDISFDPHAGEVATGRLFSGKMKRGEEVFVMGTAGKSNRLQQVGIFMGPKRVEVEELLLRKYCRGYRVKRCNRRFHGYFPSADDTVRVAEALQ